MEIKEIKKHQKNIKTFFCEKCDFTCSKKGDWNRHITRAKHLSSNDGNEKTSKKHQKTSDVVVCECGKKFVTKAGLWKHLKNCKNIIDNPDKQVTYVNMEALITPELVIKLIEQNNELQQTLVEQNKTIIELSKNSGNNHHNTIQTNSNNKTFNLQIFLNETCKDAINMSDFIKQIKVSLEDLEQTGQLGYADGISNIFIKNLNEMDVTERPIHCSDIKRETVYVKDYDHWIKETDDKPNITNAIKQVAHQNMKQLIVWQKENPEYNDPDSKKSDKYQKLIYNSMPGITKEEEDKNYNKIIKNIVKEVTINKNML